MRPWIIECVFPDVKDHGLLGMCIWRDDGTGNWGVGYVRIRERKRGECLKEIGKD